MTPRNRALAGAAALVVAALVIYGLVYLNYQRIMTTPIVGPAPQMKVQGTPDQVARGAHLVSSFPGCMVCHVTQISPNPIFDGNVAEDTKPLGYVPAPNLTPASRIKDWSDGELVRAVRDGIMPDGTPMIVMPTQGFSNLTDSDAEAIVAYLRAQPAVEKDLGRTSLNPVGIILFGAGIVPVSSSLPKEDLPEPRIGPTADYGRYLVTISNCRDCHGPNLDGNGARLGLPRGASLLRVKEWTQDQFFATMREGIDPNGNILDSAKMPWLVYRNGSDEDIKAIFEYMKILPFGR